MVFLSSSPTMSSESSDIIAEQVKVDILSKNHALDNDAKVNEISRTFICKISIIPKIII